MTNDQRRKAYRWSVLVIVIGLLAWRGWLPTRSEQAQVRATVRQFMAARLSRDDTRVRSFLSTRMHAEYVAQPVATLIGDVDLHYHRYRILDSRRASSGSWLVQVRVDEHIAGAQPSQWFVDSITLVPVNGTWQVDQVVSGPYHAADKR